MVNPEPNYDVNDNKWAYHDSRLQEMAPRQAAAGGATRLQELHYQILDQQQ